MQNTWFPSETTFSGSGMISIFPRLCSYFPHRKERNSKMLHNKWSRIPTKRTCRMDKTPAFFSRYACNFKDAQVLSLGHSQLCSTPRSLSNFTCDFLVRGWGSFHHIWSASDSHWHHQGQMLSQTRARTHTCAAAKICQVQPIFLCEKLILPTEPSKSWC